MERTGVANKTGNTLEANFFRMCVFLQKCLQNIATTLILISVFTDCTDSMNNDLAEMCPAVKPLIRPLLRPASIFHEFQTHVRLAAVVSPPRCKGIHMTPLFVAGTFLNQGIVANSKIVLR